MLKGASFYDTKYFCRHGSHFIMQTEIAHQKNGRAICPQHHRPVRLSTNNRPYKKRAIQ